MVVDTSTPAQSFSKLTPRERDVMHYVALGKPNKLIAAELGVSQRTVEAHRARVFQKLSVRNAVELVRTVMQSGEAPPLSQQYQDTEQSGAR
ncbi:helix-turn-helix transcriptional regulator [Pusillimonas sp. CC-YST705]|uniref:Helix-turn-helix transcriptional regulator n=1 Tax=Mesopusillimonas faecipullorum TaxID=2755040 RepID=A0ABS8C9I3_9BURK|nr:helix-turn-helix transcriptional regulator [Mesopusillimonas faecipullorum]MCB5362692.1 helix-turn-helix transcriptional regulator [Mesopusillimonas faecipullorum]